MSTMDIYQRQIYSRIVIMVTYDNVLAIAICHLTITLLTMVSSRGCYQYVITKCHPLILVTILTVKSPSFT